jgi:hypothetical protein
MSDGPPFVGRSNIGGSDRDSECCASDDGSELDRRETETLQKIFQLFVVVIELVGAGENRSNESWQRVLDIIRQLTSYNWSADF